MRAHILPRRWNLFGCLAVAALLGACASSGPLSNPASSPCGAGCKQVTLAMAYTANLSGSINLGNDPNTNTLQRITKTTTDRINYALSTVSVLGKDWTTVWGPVVVLEPNQAPFPTTYPVPANTMFVAKKNNANTYVIGIAGTNPVSFFDWEDEDFAATPVLWPGTIALQGIRITQGTLTGLQILEGMQSGQTPTTLYNFLKGVAANQATIYITGHSLGGTLAPALGLWLAEQKGDWDPNSNTTLQVYSFAGATPGDRAFAKHVEKYFPGGDGNNDMVIVDNSLDVVPHAFNLDSLNQLDDLYLQNPASCKVGPTQLICIYPTAAEQKDINKAVAGAQEASNDGIQFARLGTGGQVQGFTGDLKSHTELTSGVDCPLLKAVPSTTDDYAKEAIYQHVCAYPTALGPAVQNLNQTLAACRAKYPNG